jgi:hypothetical protein
MKPGTHFEHVAKTSTETSLIWELWMLIREKKKYWLMPIVLTLLFLGVLVLLSGSAAAPFIYTLF